MSQHVFRPQGDQQEAAHQHSEHQGGCTHLHGVGIAGCDCFEGHRDENADELEDHECDDPEKAGDYAWILTCRSLRYGLVGNGGHIISVILAG